MASKSVWKKCCFLFVRITKTAAPTTTSEKTDITMMIASDYSYKVYLIVLTFYRLWFTGEKATATTKFKIRRNKIVKPFFLSLSFSLSRVFVRSNQTKFTGKLHKIASTKTFLALAISMCSFGWFNCKSAHTIQINATSWVFFSLRFFYIYECLKFKLFRKLQ